MLSGKPISRTQTRAYIRSIPGLPATKQRQMAEDAGCKPIFEFGTSKTGRDVRADWLDSLRAGDIAWLPSILCLVLPPEARTKRLRPVSDLGAVLAELCSRGVVIYDARADLQSVDLADPENLMVPRRWADHVRWAMDRASQGERSRASMIRAIKKANAKREPGIVTRWKAKAKAGELKAARMIWTSTLFTSDVEAAAALPEDLAKLSGPTLRRILGRRRPGDKRAGGRPRKVGR
ncbi:hypothetical protein UFOVP1157_46 [uncultured Caudovirales phage]|uniref:Resolvase, N-terminal n=1 Tax=uncultured Caudovirales phage TaxID=2100421 RepID=A0A6J5R2B3_9CAUD|nr:hypothetical protein UFOVP497_49 [uncultured Caudovirales phage]CAB4164390.1 hypothetical protein UFOVP834_25 [uncultured Caudovirales phage]CAB4172389.1 hypothetical protein UFOVP922_46 [uncultured Caudovirales phage]CAB4177720.1 hypothetical protein UFOVP1006_39 [uncultured Caudovirales phage]CAB4184102.1 hypothetical protein UFOVP1096_41 [uncultured Caudovirales phage]